MLCQYRLKHHTVCDCVLKVPYASEKKQVESLFESDAELRQAQVCIYLFDCCCSCLSSHVNSNILLCVGADSWWGVVMSRLCAIKFANWHHPAIGHRVSFAVLFDLLLLLLGLLYAHLTIYGGRDCCSVLICVSLIFKKFFSFQFFGIN